MPLVEAHHNRPQAVALKVKIPIHDFPKVCTLNLDVHYETISDYNFLCSVIYFQRK